MSTESSRTFFIETLGCQMNVYDSELLHTRFVVGGYAPVPAADVADVVLVNTCSIRKKAEAKAWKRLTAYSSFKGRNGRPVLVLCGCVASRTVHGLAEQNIGSVDIVAGCGSYDLLLPAVDAALSGSANGPRPVYLEDSPLATYRMESRSDPAPLKAFVNISRGCNSECAYCVVPSARGPHRSRPLPEIVDEVTALAERGAREVTLLGQNVNVYSHSGLDFADVLSAIDDVSQVRRIRFTSSHPKDMDPRAVSAIAELGSVCEHVHLPLQSGSDIVLQTMRRGYTTERYRSVVRDLRTTIPGVAISTDLMVGFPGETGACFEESLQFVAEMEFDAAFTFKYSERPGTPALNFPGRVPEHVKGVRLERLIELQNQSTDACNRRLLGCEVEVLVEGADRRSPEKLSGRTRTNKLVSFDGSPDLVGSLVGVSVESAGRWALRGRRMDHRPKGGQTS